MYRPSKKPPKGVWSRHLQEQRRLRDISAVVAFELVYERIGWSPKSRSAYVAIDSGDRQPKPEEARVLAEEFGWPPDPEINDDLEGASLASALLAIAGELRAAREERALAQAEREALAQKVEEIEAVLDGLVAQARQDGDGLPAPLSAGR